ATISFLDAKNDEIINIFSKKGTSKEKETIYELLTDINPTLTHRYETIKD
ncbi:MAG: DUF4835 family protein, partial [Paludibacteraceae bacterium]|nr:DUF4835 family protein [Paludibacteraceae bacterium]